MAANEFRVAPGASVFNNKGRLCQPGELLRAGGEYGASDFDCTIAKAKDDAMSGYVIPADNYLKETRDTPVFNADGRAKEGEVEGFVELPPGTQKLPPVVERDSATDTPVVLGEPAKLIVQGPSGAIETTRPVAGVTPPASLADVTPGGNVNNVAEPQEVVTGNGTPVTTGNTPAPGTPAESAASKWTIDPATLEGKSLEQLNVIASDIDPTIAPFDDVGEAKSQLSKDFKPIG